ncbi:MAG: ISAs1 family transposase [Candidatus Hydrogenedentes bacterium]|nr:ISAs1 family transposase [Candidatus Hydrogenedentota bacterium]
MLTIALFAVMAWADGWAGVAKYGRAKLGWLKTFLDLPHGIPSHDTFGDVFARLNPEAFERCFQQWMSSMVQLSGGKLVAIDGKSLRHSFEHGWDKSGMAHRGSHTHTGAPRPCHIICTDMFLSKLTQSMKTEVFFGGRLALSPAVGTIGLVCHRRYDDNLFWRQTVWPGCSSDRAASCRPLQE